MVYGEQSASDFLSVLGSLDRGKLERQVLSAGAGFANVSGVPSAEHRCDESGPSIVF